MTPSPPPMLGALRSVSSRLGADPELVQGAGGNTSCKADGVLWVKASGRWLMHAEREPMFVPLDLAALQRGIATGDAAAATGARLPLPGGEALRPSIETSLHALLPHPVVLHVHSVAALAWLACRTPDAAFAARLQGLRWARVPYARPGLALTQAVRETLAGRAADLLLLDSHGLVAGADTPAAAEALVGEAVRRLEGPRAAAAPPSPAELAALTAMATGSAYRPATDPACHALARDPRQRAFAAGGAPWPDHVVFLGGGLPARAATDPAPPALAASQAPVWLVESLGVLVHPALDAAGLAMLRCLADVAARIAARPDAEPVYLPQAEVQALAQWDAEKFRRAQAV